jgi:hypothetical protein
MAPAPTTKKTPKTVVKVKDGVATVFMHADVSSVSVNGETFARPANVTGRVWSFECSPADASALIDSYEFASGSEAGVPLTVDEKSALEDLKSRSNIETAQLARALASIAEDRIKSDAAQATT